jgi:hypothetical protein
MRRLSLPVHHQVHSLLIQLNLLRALSHPPEQHLCNPLHLAQLIWTTMEIVYFLSLTKKVAQN